VDLSARLSARAGSELHIVHVLPGFPRYAYPGVTPRIYSRVLDETLRGARDLLKKHREGSGPRLPVSHTQETGSATAELTIWDTKKSRAGLS